jgi:hypothetical protein
MKRMPDDKLHKFDQWSFNLRLLLVWHGYWVAESGQVKAVLNAIEWVQNSVDEILLVFQRGDNGCLWASISITVDAGPATMVVVATLHTI